MATALKSAPKSFEVPYRSEVVDARGYLSEKWQYFFRILQQTVASIGTEKSFPIVNEQILPANIEGLSFDSGDFSQVIVDYLIQRITTGTNPVEKIESGTFHLVYRPTSETWVMVQVGSPGPDTSGVTLTVTTDGQAQYISTLVDGSPSISRIVYRARTLSAKSSLYSRLGSS